MIADYKCIKCSTITEYKKTGTDNFPKTIKCKKCGKIAKRLFTANVIIPPHMKASN